MTGEMDIARGVLRVEARGIERVADRLDETFSAVVDALVGASTVHVSGVGKSGAVGRKIAGTMSSLGTPAFFLDPTEALHGDLGKIRSGDVVVLISRSGRCRELRELQRELVRRRGTYGLTLVALTGAPDSEFADRCDLVLDCSVGEEADWRGLVPTASTAATLAVGDALALALSRRRAYDADDFRGNHPGGAIGEDAAVLGGANLVP